MFQNPTNKNLSLKAIGMKDIHFPPKDDTGWIALTVMVAILYPVCKAIEIYDWWKKEQ